MFLRILAVAGILLSLTSCNAYVIYNSPLNESLTITPIEAIPRVVVEEPKVTTPQIAGCKPFTLPPRDPKPPIPSMEDLKNAKNVDRMVAARLVKYISDLRTYTKKRERLVDDEYKRYLRECFQ